MAATVAGRRLTERQRRQQVALRAAVVRAVLRVWPGFDIRAIDESWSAIEPALLAIIDAGRRTSADLAAAYYTALRTVEGMPGRFTPPLLIDTAWQGAAQTSLRVTGPIAAKSAVRRNLPDAGKRALTMVSGAVARHTLDGGRETLLQAVRQDSEQSRRRIGWARVGSGSPCSFCAMLISRGAVYGERSGAFQSHDHCSCTLEPQFRPNEGRNPQAQKYIEIWRQADGDRKQFRRLIEGRDAA